MEYIYKANLARRILATLIDYFIFGSFCLVYVFVFGKEEANGSYAVRNLMVLPIIGMWFFYYVFIEGRFGNTIGHSLLKLKVITVDRKDIRIGDAFVRHFLDPIDILCLGIPGLVSIALTKKHQRLGDLAAKVIVIDRTDRDQSQPFAKMQPIKDDEIVTAEER